MTSQFLHLEDIKQNAFLETLRINDCLVSDITTILSEINTKIRYLIQKSMNS